MKAIINSSSLNAGMVTNIIKIWGFKNLYTSGTVIFPVTALAAATTGDTR